MTLIGREYLLWMGSGIVASSIYIVMIVRCMFDSWVRVCSELHWWNDGVSVKAREGSTAESRFVWSNCYTSVVHWTP